MVSFAFATLAIAACKPTDSAPPPASDAPVKCAADGDCHAGPCGPCTSGAPITEADSMRECVVNPCGHATAACVNHVCVVR